MYYVVDYEHDIICDDASLTQLTSNLKCVYEKQKKKDRMNGF